MEPTQLSYTVPEIHEKDRVIFGAITADLLKPLMGFAIIADRCGQCESKDVQYVLSL